MLRAKGKPKITKGELRWIAGKTTFRIQDKTRNENNKKLIVKNVFEINFKSVYEQLPETRADNSGTRTVTLKIKQSALFTVAAQEQKLKPVKKGIGVSARPSNCEITLQLIENVRELIRTQTDERSILILIARHDNGQIHEPGKKRGHAACGHAANL